MAEGAEQPRLLRSRTIASGSDTDYVGTNTAIDIPTFAMPHAAQPDGRAFTGVDVWILAVDASRVIQNRSGTVQVELLEVIDRSLPALGGSAGDAAVNTDEDPTLSATVPLQRRWYFPVNGSKTLTIRLSAFTGLPGGATTLQVWWRAVAR